MGTPTLREHHSKINETAGGSEVPAPVGRLASASCAMIDPTLTYRGPIARDPEPRRRLGDVRTPDLATSFDTWRDALRAARHRIVTGCERIHTWRTGTRGRLAAGSGF